MSKFDQKKYPFPEILEYLKKLYPNEKLEDIKDNIISIKVDGQKVTTTYNMLIQGLII